MQGLDHLRVHIIQAAAAGVEAADILDMIGGVVLGHQPTALAFIRRLTSLVTRIQRREMVGMGQVIADIEDLMIRLGAVGKMLPQILVQGLFELDRNPALVRADPDPAVEQFARA
jgi:hypothetical protein